MTEENLCVVSLTTCQCLFVKVDSKTLQGSTPCLNSKLLFLDLANIDSNNDG